MRLSFEQACEVLESKPETVDQPTPDSRMFLPTLFTNCLRAALRFRLPSAARRSKVRMLPVPRPGATAR